MNILQQLLNGIVIGHAFALIAIGWTVLVGVARLVSFAHGQLYMLGAFVAWYVAAKLGLSYPVAALAAIGVTALIGVAMQAVMLKATFDRNVVSIMIMTLGFGYALQGTAALLFGATAQMVDTPLSQREIQVSTLWVTWQDIAIVVVTIAVFGLLKWVIDHTAVGRSVRMVAEDPGLSMLGGIDVRAVYLGVFAFEGAAVALAAALVSPRTPILTSMGFDESVMTFVVVVLGGIGSISGSYIAALSLGIFSALFGAYVSPAYTMAAAFVVLVVILIVRPGGFASTGARTGHAAP